MHNPYRVLGVDKMASEKTIKASFRKLAKKYHPDQNQNDPKAQERFAAVNQAYEILGSKEKRDQFDREEIDSEGKPKFTGFEMGRGPGHHRKQSNPFGGASYSFSPGGTGGSEDILNEFLSSAFRGSGSSGGGFKRSGFNQSGFPPNIPPDQDARGGDIKFSTTVSLTELISGKAKIRFPDDKTAIVKIPAGIRDGQTIRLKGKGEIFQGHQTRGDAIIYFHIASESGFELDGDDLRTELPISIKDSVKGGKCLLTTLEGKISITVPPWSTSGRILD